jgi:Na+/H+ antiporter NhaD/arsenite permease-like protein
VFGILSGAISTVLDTFATSMSFFSLYPSLPENDMFYKMVAYSSSMGGNVLLLGSVSGLALMKMENIHMGWYLKNVGWVVILSWILGILALCLLG